MIAPERLQLHNRILLLIEVALNLLPYEVVLIVGKQACDKGDIDVHDGHVTSISRDLSKEEGSISVSSILS